MPLRGMDQAQLAPHDYAVPVFRWRHHRQRGGCRFVELKVEASEPAVGVVEPNQMMPEPVLTTAISQFVPTDSEPLKATDDDADPMPLASDPGSYTVDAP